MDYVSEFVYVYISMVEADMIYSLFHIRGRDIILTRQV